MATESVPKRRRSPFAVVRCRVLIILGILIAGIFGMSYVGDALSQESAADIMHKTRGLRKQDLLLRTFGRTLAAVKRKDWRAVSHAIKKINSNIENYNKHFGIDLKPRLEKAVIAKKSGHLLKILAQAIYFGMKVNFKTILDTGMSDYLDSKSRLNQAAGYYTKILSGNMKRKNPIGHQKIQAHFILASAALGNPGFDITLPEAPSDLRGFEEATNNIEMELTAVYTYFNE